MDGQRQRSGWGGHGRRSRQSKPQNGERPELVRIAARRPDSPILAKITQRTVAASAVPGGPGGPAGVIEPADAEPAPQALEVPRRSARIVKLATGAGDERERERQRLLGRLMTSDGRGAISRAAEEFLRHGFALPDEQAVHLQLLEHFDETRAQESLVAMTRLLATEAPIKKPVLDQRLRRLEEHADEPTTRDLAAGLRRTLRT